MRPFNLKFFVPNIFVMTLGLSFFHSEIFVHADEIDVEVKSTATKLSEWLPPWFAKSTRGTDSNGALASLSARYVGNEDVKNSLSLLSPYSLLSRFGPNMDSSSLATDVFNMYYYPENTSYLSMASILLRLLIFFMPGGGIVPQAYFIMDLSKLTLKVAYMYLTGYDTTDIAIAVAPDLLRTVVMSRRDESELSKYILHAGDTVDISSMDAASFLKYVNSIQFPQLSNDQENEIRKDLETALTKYFQNIEPADLDEMVDVFEQTIKFFALLTPYQDNWDSSNFEKNRVNRIIQIIQSLSRKFSLQKIRSLPNVIFKN